MFESNGSIEEYFILLTLITMRMVILNVYINKFVVNFSLFSKSALIFNFLNWLYVV